MLEWGPEEPSEEEMRRHARDRIVSEIGLRLTPVYGAGSRHCYRSTNSGDHSPDEPRRPGGGGGGLGYQEPGPVLILQCGLDFTVVAPLRADRTGSWSAWKSRMGKAQGGRRLQQHIHRRGQSVSIEERRFTHRLNAHVQGDGTRHNGWVQRFDLLVSGDVLHLFVNKPATKPGAHRVYYFGNSLAVWP
mgnify:CR=1 FL=1|jgi:hypothetical protein